MTTAFERPVEAWRDRHTAEYTGIRPGGRFVTTDLTLWLVGAGERGARTVAARRWAVSAAAVVAPSRGESDEDRLPGGRFAVWLRNAPFPPLGAGPGPSHVVPVDGCSFP